MICSTCQEDKPIEEFSHKNKEKGTRQSNCRSCHARWHKVYYNQHKDNYKDRNTSRKTIYIQELDKLIQSYLSTHSCVDCGEVDPIVLEFDHREPELKSFSISKARSFQYPIDKIKQEIAKCDVRCANCHRRKTHKDLFTNKQKNIEA
jgi:protein-arginine kinase activator protein McsA